jgi:hypothetical protein
MKQKRAGCEANIVGMNQERREGFTDIFEKPLESLYLRCHEDRLCR